MANLAIYRNPYTVRNMEIAASRHENATGDSIKRPLIGFLTKPHIPSSSNNQVSSDLRVRNRHFGGCGEEPPGPLPTTIPARREKTLIRKKNLIRVGRASDTEKESDPPRN